MRIPAGHLKNIPTPFYFYDMELLSHTLSVISEATKDTPDFHVHYAIKANANPKILKAIAEAGFGADCVSGGEIKAAVAAGFPAGKIVFAGVGKTMMKSVWDWKLESVASMSRVYPNLKLSASWQYRPARRQT